MSKITKRNMYEALVSLSSDGDLGFFNGDDEFVSVSWDELRAFAEKEIASLDHKAEKSRERAAEKRAAGDELGEAVKGCLSSEYITVAEILTKLAEEGVDATASKAVARLTRMCNDGVAEKTDMKMKNLDGKSVTRKGYRII